MIDAAVAAADGGTFSGTGTINGSLLNTSGTVKPGDSSPATLSVNGTYSQAVNAIFEAGIAGANANKVSKLAVTGTATLGGTLDIDLLNGFQVAHGESFNIMSFASSVGDFSSFELNGSVCSMVSADTYGCSGASNSGFLFEEEFVSGDTGLDLVIGQSAEPPPSEVPEPWTFEVFAAGLGALRHG